MAVVIHGLDQGQRAALVISEAQRGVLDPKHAIFPGLAEQCARRGTLARVAALADAFRLRDLPVVHIHVAHRPDFRGFAANNPVSARVRRERRMVEGTPQVEPMPEVALAPPDYVSTRRSGLTMWVGTDLDTALRNMRVETLVIAGVSTNLAVMTGSIGAVDRGYQVVIPEDATAGATAESHEWVVSNILRLVASVTTAQRVAAALPDLRDS